MMAANREGSDSEEGVVTKPANTTTTTTTATTVEDFDLDENLMHLGIKGFFPTGLYFILSFLVFIVPMQYMSSHVSSFTPEHRCRLANASSTLSNQPSLENAIPKDIVAGTFASCERFEDILDDEKTTEEGGLCVELEGDDRVHFIFSEL